MWPGPLSFSYSENKHLRTTVALNDENMRNESKIAKEVRNIAHQVCGLRHKYTSLHKTLS